MAVVDGVWTTDAKELMQAHLLACPNRPEKKLLDIIDAQSAAFDALVEATKETTCGFCGWLMTSQQPTAGACESCLPLRAALAQAAKVRGER